MNRTREYVELPLKLHPELMAEVDEWRGPLGRQAAIRFLIAGGLREATVREGLRQVRYIIAHIDD